MTQGPRDRGLDSWWGDWFASIFRCFGLGDIWTASFTALPEASAAIGSTRLFKNYSSGLDALYDCHVSISYYSYGIYLHLPLLNISWRQLNYAMIIQYTNVSLSSLTRLLFSHSMIRNLYCSCLPNKDTSSKTTTSSFLRQQSSKTTYLQSEYQVLESDHFQVARRQISRFKRSTIIYTIKWQKNNRGWSPKSVVAWHARKIVCVWAILTIRYLYPWFFSLRAIAVIALSLLLCFLTRPSASIHCLTTWVGIITNSCVIKAYIHLEHNFPPPIFSILEFVNLPTWSLFVQKTKHPLENTRDRTNG